MSYTSDIWLYPLQDWCKTVNEMSNFMSTGQMGNFIFCPVVIVLLGLVEASPPWLVLGLAIVVVDPFNRRNAELCRMQIKI